MGGAHCRNTRSHQHEHGADREPVFLVAKTPQVFRRSGELQLSPMDLLELLQFKCLRGISPRVQGSLQSLPTKVSPGRWLWPWLLLPRAWPLVWQHREGKLSRMLLFPWERRKLLGAACEVVWSQDVITPCVTEQQEPIPYLF